MAEFSAIPTDCDNRESRGRGRPGDVPRLDQHTTRRMVTAAATESIYQRHPLQ